MKKKLQLNTLVTSLHEILILGYTVVTFLHDNVYESYSVINLRLTTTLFVFTALQDIFLSYMMFFILDAQTTPLFVRDESQQLDYAVLNVIKTDFSISGTNLDVSD